MYSNYQKVISQNLILKETEWYFKSDDRYTQILEHMSYDFGKLYLEEIKKRFDIFYNNYKDKLINICYLNDKYGLTVKKNFNNFCECSPSNLRYILHSLLILSNIKEKKLKSIDIVEIGGGYGGLALFIHNLSQLFEININSYTIFDLPEACILQKKYLTLFQIEINTFDINDDFVLKNNSYLISNYAFSEISKEYRDLYIYKVIEPYITFGFLVWNTIPVYNFIKNKTLEILDEYPMTCTLLKNKYVYIH